MNIAIESQGYTGDSFHLVPSSESRPEGRSLNISVVDNVNSVVDAAYVAFTHMSSFIQFTPLTSYECGMINSNHLPFLNFELPDYYFSQLLLNSLTSSLEWFQPRDSSQDWFWTPEWQAGEIEVDTEIASGKFERFESGEAFLQALRERSKRNANL